MAYINFSPSQRLAIDARDKNILVSAAAGSGKTAVLVQRIIEKITDENNPVDVDKMLVVTFTQAAAGEMKDRIGRAIMAQLAENAGKPQMRDRQALLQRQYALLHKSHITTIDSFCNNVVRQNFHCTDLDPEYRIAEDRELRVIKDEAMDRLLEKYFEEYSGDFKLIAESYISKVKDDDLAELIWDIYKFSKNMPYPEKWLDESVERFKDVSNIWETDWGIFMAESVEQGLEEAKWIAYNIKNIYDTCGEYADCYEKMSIINLALIKDLINTLNNDGIEALLCKMRNGIDFAKLSRLKKTDTLSDYNKTILKNLNDSFKAVIKKIAELYSHVDSAENLEMIHRLYPVVRGIASLVKEFDQIYWSLKAEKQVVDFNDIEHFALNILIDENGNYTDAAREYQQIFDEIIIDEYQDSNYIQECILRAVSREDLGKNNIFMVGDVKQCVYKFRHANPELFIEKYNSYSTDPMADRLLIPLSGNYRSRACVISVCNFFFGQLMSSSLGGVDYDQTAALVAEADFPDADTGLNISQKGEFYIIDSTKIEEDDVGYEINQMKSVELEAELVAKKIVEMVSEKPLNIYDSKLGRYRNVMLGDIAILLHSPAVTAGIISDVFADYNINTASTGAGSLFESIEVQTVLSLLKLIDNPLRDFEMLAVLHSPIYGITCDQLASIKLATEQPYFYYAVKEYSQSNSELAEKLKVFLNDLDFYRSVLEYDTVSALVRIIYDKNGYGAYVGALPGGVIRQANLHIFREYALRYEALGKFTLCGFLDYIEAFSTYDKNKGEKAIQGAVKTEGAENAVKIMSIHKSKGLEFPVVFVMQMGKEFNKRDTYKSLLPHQQLGLGPMYVDGDLRIRCNTIPRKVIAEQMIKEQLSEEMRLLYVAMTRAKEKLIITGCCSSPADKLLKLEVLISKEEESINPCSLLNAATAMDWLLPAVIRQREFFEKNFPGEKCHVLFDNVMLETSIVDRSDIESIYNMGVIQAENAAAMLDEKSSDKADKTENSADIINMLEYKYDRIGAYDIPSTISITEIKMRSKGAEIVKEASFEPPAFLKEKETEVTGAQRGTAYHKVFEQLNFRQNYNEEMLEELLDKMVSLNMLLPEEREEIECQKIITFLNSPVGQRIKASDEIFCETPFTMMMPVEDALNAPELAHTGAGVLVRGVIDLYFVEKGSIVLLDYKTDKATSEKYYVENYAIQLKLYKEALEKSTGMTVKEVYIYAVNRKDGFIKMP